MPEFVPSGCWSLILRVQMLGESRRWLHHCSHGDLVTHLVNAMASLNALRNRRCPLAEAPDPAPRFLRSQTVRSNSTHPFVTRERRDPSAGVQRARVGTGTALTTPSVTPPHPRFHGSSHQRRPCLRVRQQCPASLEAATAAPTPSRPGRFAAAAVARRHPRLLTRGSSIAAGWHASVAMMLAASPHKASFLRCLDDYPGRWIIVRHIPIGFSARSGTWLRREVR